MGTGSQRRTAARLAQEGSAPMHPYSITSPSTRRLSIRIHFGNCVECGVLFCKRRRADMRFCSRICYGTYRSREFRGERHSNYKGLVRRGNYLARFLPDHPLADSSGYVLEHRRVAHDAGIYVAGHHVHHKNGDKHDNRLQNLAVLDAAEHHRRHVKEAGYVVNQSGRWPVKQ